jgi:hypothetical protein
MSDKVVLEGRITVNVLVESWHQSTSASFSILHELHKVFSDHYDLSQFVNRIIAFPEKTFLKLKLYRSANWRMNALPSRQLLQSFNDLSRLFYHLRNPPVRPACSGK